MHRHRVTSPRLRRRETVRLLIQLGFAALLNGYAAGFAKGRIFQGKTKLFCVPVLNCYSCPGALGSCPIGALQAVLNGSRFPFYVLGTMMLFGVLCGRLLCGFVCPFGLLQDLLSKLPLPKLTVPRAVDRPARLLKYGVLLVLVILLPLFFTDEMGSRSPAFCEFFSPAGTLEAGIPLVLLNGDLRELIGGLFFWKIGVLAFMILGALLIPRFFCRYFCPLGAFYAFFNKFSLYQLKLDKGKCTGCKTCEKACPMAIEVTKSVNSFECVRCGRCKAACPENAISAEFLKRWKKERPCGEEGLRK